MSLVSAWRTVPVGRTLTASSSVEIEVQGPDWLDGFSVYARVGGQIVGRLTGGKWNAVEKVWVDPTHRRKGIATQMYRALEEAAARAGIEMRRPDEFSDAGAAWYSNLTGKEYGSTWGSDVDWTDWSRRTASTSDLFWRVHPAGRPFGVEDATSTPFYDPNPPYQRTERGGPLTQRGYSCFANAWHLWVYTMRMGWGRVGTDVIGFSGTATGEQGSDGEDLAVPDMRTVRRMSWEEFERTVLPAEPFPPSPAFARWVKGFEWNWLGSWGETAKQLAYLGPEDAADAEIIRRHPQVRTAALPSGIRFETAVMPDDLRQRQPIGGTVYAFLDGGNPEELTYPYLKDCVGILRWYSNGEIDSVWVHPDLRRQGLASDLLRRAREADPTVHHSDVLTPAGAAWSQRVGATFHPKDLHLRFRPFKETLGRAVTVHAVEAWIGPDEVGHLYWFPGDDVILEVEVSEEYRRQGIATKMLGAARVIEPGLRHSDMLSADGEAWMQAVGSVPSGLTFEHDESQTGGSKWPVQHDLIAMLDGVEVGRLTYLTGTRANSKVLIDSLDVDSRFRRRGIASSLMDEMQRRHPGVTVDHGDRTDDGKAWWSGYTRGKSVTRGRTMASRGSRWTTTWHRGMTVMLNAKDERALSVLAALASGATNAARDRLIELMAGGTGYDPWTGNKNGPRSGAGGWWTTDESAAWTYASTASPMAAEDDDAVFASVIFHAEIDESIEAETDGSGYSWHHLEPGTPLTLTGITATLPAPAQARLLLDLARSQGGWWDPMGMGDMDTWVNPGLTEPYEIEEHLYEWDLTMRTEASTVRYEYEPSRSEYGGLVRTTPRVVAYDGQREIGSLNWDVLDPSLFGTVTVHPAYRRRGIATALWEEARRVNPDLDPTTSVFYTPDGRAFVDSLTRTAGPAGNMVPFGRFPLLAPERHLSAPRDVKVLRMAQGDIDRLHPGQQARVAQVLDDLRAGRARVEPKERPPLVGSYTVRVTNSLRLGLYISEDQPGGDAHPDWVVYWVGAHNYEEAERRMQRNGSTRTASYFHGSDREFEPGDLILPSAETGAPNWAEQLGHTGPLGPHYDPNQVYLSDTNYDAGVFGNYVYEVEPEGEIEIDPESAHLMPGYRDQPVWSRAPRARVIRKVIGSMERTAGPLDPTLAGQITFEWVETTRGEKMGIRAFHPEGKPHPWDAKQLQPIGELRWGPQGEITRAVVDKPFRRQGLATELLRRAREVNPGIHHSRRLTDMGRAWSRAVASQHTASVSRAADLPDVGPMPDDYWGSGGCGALALAFVTLFPEMKIAVEWGTGHDEGLVWHAVAYDPATKIGHDYTGTGMADWMVGGFFNGTVEMDVSPQRVADAMDVLRGWDPGEPWGQHLVYEAAMAIEKHWGLWDEESSLHTATEDIYYHGTSVPLAPGARIVPAQPLADPSTWDTSQSTRGPSARHNDPTVAYATSSMADAWWWAEHAWNSGRGTLPRVYQVRPLGPVHPDPNNEFEGDVVSPVGFEVVTEITEGDEAEFWKEGGRTLDSLNPTGGVFVDYDPQARATAPLGPNLTTLAETQGVDPQTPVRIYRGAPEHQRSIVPGDFVTTDERLARDYGGRVLSLDVTYGDLLDDRTEPGGEEYIYRPGLAREAARSRGLDYESAWAANSPTFTVVGNVAPMIGGDWEGHAVLAREQMSYTDALDPMRFIDGLAAKARTDYNVTDRGATMMYLIASGRGGEARGGEHIYWVVGEMPVGGSRWQPSRVSINGQYGRRAEANPRFLNALAYTRGEEARKWIGENLAGVLVDESMFEDLAQTVTVYRGISLHPDVDPLTASKGDGSDLGSSWTVSLDAAKAIAERGMAGFTGAQTLGDTYEIDPTTDNARRNYVPTVLRAEVTLLPPDQGGPAPYRPWTIDYASEAEIDIPRGTEINLNGILRASKNVRSRTEPHPEFGFYTETVTWSWNNSWRNVNVRRTATLMTDDEVEAEAYDFAQWHGEMWRNSPEAETMGVDDGIAYEYLGRTAAGEGLIEAQDGSNVIGTLNWWNGTISSVWVARDHRRRGIATRMLGYARQIEPGLKHSVSLSDDGRAWSQVVGAARHTAMADLMVGQDVYYRTHDRMRAFSLDDATSAPLRGSLDEDPQEGYSALPDPWSLWGYVTMQGWTSFTFNDDVLIFSGIEVGTGHDGEPLVVPDGKVERWVPWRDFLRELSHNTTTAPHSVLWKPNGYATPLTEVAATAYLEDPHDPVAQRIIVDNAEEFRFMMSNSDEELEAWGDSIPLPPYGLDVVTPRELGLLFAQRKTAMPDAEGWWYHYGRDLARYEMGHYTHLGTREAAEKRHSGLHGEGNYRHDGTLMRAKIAPRSPLNSPSNPMSDHEANALLLWEGEIREGGVMPAPENDGDVKHWAYNRAGTIMEIAAKYGYQGSWAHDAFFYVNDVEDRGSISVAVDPDCIVEQGEAPPTNESVGEGQLLLWAAHHPTKE